MSRQLDVGDEILILVTYFGYWYPALLVRGRASTVEDVGDDSGQFHELGVCEHHKHAVGSPLWPAVLRFVCVFRVQRSVSIVSGPASMCGGHILPGCGLPAPAGGARTRVI